MAHWRTRLLAPGDPPRHNPDWLTSSGPLLDRLGARHASRCQSAVDAVGIWGLAGHYVGAAPLPNLDGLSTAEIRARVNCDFLNGRCELRISMSP